MTKKLAVGVFLVGLGMATGGPWFAARAQVISPAPAPVPLSKAIVGLWRGDAILCDTRTNFLRVDIEIRFTDYGIATVRRDPFSSCGSGVGATSFAADYLIVGTGVLMSPHSNRPLITLSGITIADDRLEALSSGNGSIFLGSGLSLKRQ